MHHTESSHGDGYEQEQQACQVAESSQAEDGFDLDAWLSHISSPRMNTTMATIMPMRYPMANDSPLFI